MTLTLAIVIAVVVIALAFDYTNGFHDAANAIATSVSTRALTPRIALTLAALMNFIGALLGQEVAKTVADVIKIEDESGQLLVDNAHVGLVIVMAGLLGAITWNLITWYFGLPSSSSHALIGGLVGSALAAGLVLDDSSLTVNWDTIVKKVVVPMVASPLVGFVLAFLVMLAIFNRFDSSVEEASWSLGVSPGTTFRKVTFPLIFPGVLSAMLFAFTLSYDEFSRTLFASGREQTLPLAIYSALQLPGGEAAVTRLAMISVFLSLLALVASELLARRSGIGRGSNVV